jgi:uncharacterized protein (DUF433 family)
MARGELRPEIYLTGIQVAEIAYTPKPDAALTDRREWPIYSLSEIAYFLDIPKATLHAWSRPYKRRGREYPALIPPARAEGSLYSFFNLAEAHILSTTIRVFGVKIDAVRRAAEEVRRKYSGPDDHPLLSENFLTDGKHIFIQYLEKHSKHTENLSLGGQMGMTPILDAYLERIERDEAWKPKKIYPARQKGKLIAIMPSVSSGRPVIDGTGIPVASIWNRHNAGDSIEYLADDYEIPELQIEGAIGYIEQLRKAA